MVAARLEAMSRPEFMPDRSTRTSSEPEPRGLPGDGGLPPSAPAIPSRAAVNSVGTIYIFELVLLVILGRV